MNVGGTPDNLTSWEPGQSGNPAGKPSFRDEIAKVGAMIVERDGIKVTKTRASVLAAFELAEKGDTNAFRFLAQHSEGVKIENVNSGEITITVKREEPKTQSLPQPAVQPLEN